MSGVETVDARAEAGHDGDQVADQPRDVMAPLTVGEPIPAVCHIADLCRIFQRSRTYVFAHRREFAKFLLKGSTTEWSGYRIASHLTGGSFAITVKRS